MQNILVIDDEKAISEVLSQALNRFGFHVDTAENGAEGIVKFDKEVFDLVITDVRMAGIDGNDVVRHIETMQAELDVSDVLIADASATSLRDQFALAAMAGRLAGRLAEDEKELNYDTVARWSYRMANAMLKTRERKL